MADQDLQAATDAQPVIKQVAAENKLRLVIANDPEVRALDSQSHGELMKRLNKRLIKRATEPTKPVIDLSPMNALRAGGQMVKGAAQFLSPFPRTSAEAYTEAVGSPAAMYALRAGKAQVAEGEKAIEARSRGHASEAFGHGMAALTPVYGPMAADVGETLGKGDVFGAATKGAALAGSLKAPGKAGGAAEEIAGAAHRAGEHMATASATKARAEFVKDMAEVAKPSGSRMTGFGQKAGQLAPYIAKEAELHEASTGSPVKTYQDLSTILGKIAEKGKGEYIEYAAQQLKSEVDKAATEQYKSYQAQASRSRITPTVGGIGNIHHAHPLMIARLRLNARPKLAETRIPGLIEKAQKTAGRDPWPSQPQLDKVQVLMKANPKNLNEGTVAWAIRHSLPIPKKVLARFPDLATRFPNTIREAP